MSVLVVCKFRLVSIFAIALLCVPSAMRAGQIDWTYGLGDTSNIIRGIAVGSGGDIYVSHSTSGGVGGSSYLDSFDLQGNRKWTTTAPTSGAIGTFGSSIYLAGPVVGPDESNNVTGGAFKFDSSGQLLWGRTTPDLLRSTSNHLAISQNGDVIVSGNYATGITHDQEPWIRRYSSSGSVLGGLEFGTDKRDGITGIDTDSNGRVYVTGYSQGDLFSNRQSGTDATIAQLSNDTIVWGKQFAEGTLRTSASLVTDATGISYVLGGYSDFSPAAGGYYLRKYSPAGTLLFDKKVPTEYVPSIGADELSGITFGPDGNLYAIGSSYGSSFGPSNGGRDISLASFDVLGNLLWSDQIGTAGDDSATDFQVGADGNLYISGYLGGTQSRGEPSLIKYVPDPTPSASEHLIVLTHGFSPGRDESEGPYIQALESSIRERLISEGVSEDNLHFITQSWSEAYAPPILLGGALFYDAAYMATEDAGEALATQIQELMVALNTTPTIHMVGHSLGSVVNAYAVNKLYESGVTVDLVTILDSPKRTSIAVVGQIGIEGQTKRNLAEFDDAFFFWKTMPNGSVEYVENFFGPSEATLVVPVFGQPIAGTVPCDDGGCFGREIRWANHTTLWSQFYRQAIENPDYSTSWKTPALYGDESPYAATATWHPDGLLATLVEAFNTIPERSAEIYLDNIRFLTGNSPDVNNWQRVLGTIAFEDNGVLATSNSPSAFSANLAADSVLGMVFSYEVNNATTGILTLEFDDLLLWEIDLSEFSSLFSDTVYISTENFYGSGLLVWTYDSDEIGSTAFFSDFQVVGVRPLLSNPVPEPSSLFLVALAFVSLGFRYRVRPFRSSAGESKTC